MMGPTKDEKAVRAGSGEFAARERDNVMDGLGDRGTNKRKQSTALEIRHLETCCRYVGTLPLSINGSLKKDVP